MAGGSELLQHGRIQRFATGAGDVAQQSAKLIGIGQGQINSGDAVLQFCGDLPIGGGDDEGMGGPGQFGSQIAQSPADAGIVAEAMEILEQQQGTRFWWQGAQQFQGGRGVAGRLAQAARRATESADEVPAQQEALALALGQLLEQHHDPLFLKGADPKNGGAGADQQIQLVGQGRGHGLESGGAEVAQGRPTRVSLAGLAAPAVWTGTVAATTVDQG